MNVADPLDNARLSGHYRDMNTTQELTEGQTVTLIAGPGYPTEARYLIVGAGERHVAALRTDYDGSPVEMFTLRRNGKYALKGGTQWANYLRAVK